MTFGASSKTELAYGDFDVILNKLKGKLEVLDLET
jgi:hypothetical protein